MSHELDGGRIDEAAGGREPPSPGGDEGDSFLLRWPEDGLWWRWFEQGNPHLEALYLPRCWFHNCL